MLYHHPISMEPTDAAAATVAPVYGHSSSSSCSSSKSSRSHSRLQRGQRQRSRESERERANTKTGKWEIFLQKIFACPRRFLIFPWNGDTSISFLFFPWIGNTSINILVWFKLKVKVVKDLILKLHLHSGWDTVPLSILVLFNCLMCPYNGLEYLFTMASKFHLAFKFPWLHSFHELTGRLFQISLISCHLTGNRETQKTITKTTNPLAKKKKENNFLCGFFTCYRRF